MSEKHSELASQHIDFINKQHMFFVSTAATDGYINLSPKGMDTFRVLDQNRITWLNLTGSGNETAAHVMENSRMTIMFCSYERQPLILRLYGQAQVLHPRDALWPEYLAHFGKQPGARNIFTMQIDLVQTSCGYAVPLYELKGERPILKKWAEAKGEEGIRQYWQDKNQLTINDKPTGILAEADK